MRKMDNAEKIVTEFYEKFGEWLEMTTHQDLLLIQLMADEIVNLRKKLEYYERCKKC